MREERRRRDINFGGGGVEGNAARQGLRTAGVESGPPHLFSMNEERLEQPFVDALWDALKKQACCNPATAVRIVILTKKDLEAALGEMGM